MLRIVSLIVILALATGVAAQSTPTVLQPGNTLGEVSATNPYPTYLFLSTAGQPLYVKVLSLTPGFSPNLRILGPSAEVEYQMFGAGANEVDGQITLAQAGVHLFMVESGSGVPGQFLITLQPGNSSTGIVVGSEAIPATDVPAVELSPANPAVFDTVNPITTRKFAFSALPVSLTVRITSLSLPAGPIVELKDATQTTTLALGSPRAIDLSFNIPPGTERYVLEVISGGSPGDEMFTIELIFDASLLQPTLESGLDAGQVPLPFNGPCVVATSGTQSVNIRSGAGETFPVVGQLQPNQTATVIQQAPGFAWYQISVNGTIGWVAKFVVREGGNCAGIRVATAPPPLPPAQPTVSEPPALVPSATSQPSPTATFEASPTVMVEPSPTEDPSDFEIVTPES